MEGYLCNACYYVVGCLCYDCPAVSTPPTPPRMGSGMLLKLGYERSSGKPGFDFVIRDCTIIPFHRRPELIFPWQPCLSPKVFSILQPKQFVNFAAVVAFWKYISSSKVSFLYLNV